MDEYPFKKFLVDDGVEVLVGIVIYVGLLFILRAKILDEGKGTSWREAEEIVFNKIDRITTYSVKKYNKYDTPNF